MGDQVMTEEEFYLEDLKSKFLKINPEEYILAYSGGRDSHFIYWFLKVWLKDNDYDMWMKYKTIKIVSSNTRMEHPQILRRMLDNSDVVLLPKMKPYEIKDKYGIPCFSKVQDEFIRRYHNGSRSDNTINYVLRKKETMFKLTKRASKLLINNELHKIDNKCCDELKKKPMKKYSKLHNVKRILGTRSSESMIRKKTLKNGCFSSKDQFTPIHDLTEDLLKKIEIKYNIDIPDVYDSVQQTGCMGCPYGCNSKRCNTITELSLLPKNKRNYIIEYFKESYDILGIDYQQFDEE